MPKPTLSAEEFYEWANHPTTRKIQEVLLEQVKESRVDLSRKIAGYSPDKLQYYAGYADGVEATAVLRELFEFNRPNQEEDQDEA